MERAKPKPIDNPSQLSTRHRIRFLAKDSMLYGGALAFSRVFSLITFPVLARHFSVADYGLIDFFTVLAGLLATFFIFGQDSAIARYFYEYEDEDARRQLISQSLILQMGFVLTLLPLLWIAARMIVTKLSDATVAELLLKLILVQVPFLVLINFSQNLLKWTFVRSRFLIMSLGYAVLNVALLLVAVLIFNIGMVGVLGVSLVVQMFSGLVGLFFVRRWLLIPRNFVFLRELLPFAIPYGVIGCVGAFSPILERSLVTNLLGSHELGLYAAGAKVALFISLFIQAFQTAWGPFSLAIYQQSDAAHTYNWVLKAFAMCICIAVLLLSAIAQPMILLLASDRYVGASIVVFPLAMGLAIQATGWITEIGIGFSKRSHLSLYSYAVYIGVTFISIRQLTPVLGLLGAALGVLIGYAAKSIVTTWIAQRAYALPWEFHPIIAFMVGTIAIGLIGTWSGLVFSTMAASLLYTIGSLILLVMGWLLLFGSHDRHLIVSEIRAIGVLFRLARKEA